MRSVQWRVKHVGGFARFAVSQAFVVFFFCALSFSEDPTGLNQWTKRVGRNVAMVHRGLDRHLIDHSETDVSSEQLASLARLNYSQHPLLLPLSLSSNHALRTLNTKSGPSQDT